MQNTDPRSLSVSSLFATARRIYAESGEDIDRARGYLETAAIPEDIADRIGAIITFLYAGDTITEFDKFVLLARLGLYRIVFGRVPVNIREWATFAARMGRADILQYLIVRGANNFNDIVMTAAEGGHTLIVRDLIRHHGANVNHALRGAATGGHLPIVEEMIGLGADYVDPAMAAAAYRGRVDVINYLAAHGANDFESATMYAGRGGSTAAIDALIALGATHVGLNGAMEEAARHGHLGTIDYLVARGVRNYNGALIAASEQERKNVIDHLLDIHHKFDLETLNEVMENAAYQGRGDIVDTMIRQGANSFVSAFNAATDGGHLELAEYLRELAHHYRRNPNRRAL